MAMGRDSEVQSDLIVTWAEIPRSPGHVFYDKLQKLLAEAGFDGFVEKTCKPYYAPRMGAPSLPPGRYFRMLLIGYFEGIDSERGLEWRCADPRELVPVVHRGDPRAAKPPSWSERSGARGVPVDPPAQAQRNLPEPSTRRAALSAGIRRLLTTDNSCSSSMRSAIFPSSPAAGTYSSSW